MMPRPARLIRKADARPGVRGTRAASGHDVVLSSSRTDEA